MNNLERFLKQGIPFITGKDDKLKLLEEGEQVLTSFHIAEIIKDKVINTMEDYGYLDKADNVLRHLEANDLFKSIPIRAELSMSLCNFTQESSLWFLSKDYSLVINIRTGKYQLNDLRSE